jgi:hypothetical protein
MTLNITVLTPTVIYQSGDYRLSDPATGKAEHIPSTKAVSISYFDWSGFLTYTGIGRVGSRHTSDFVREWLRNRGASSFGEVVEILRESGSAWLARVAPRSRHTFVLAAFANSEPVVAVISNYQRWHGADEGVVATEMFVSEVRPKKRAEIIVTGLRAAVSRQQRRELQRLAERHADEPLRVRTTLSQITRLAARAFPNLISDDSFVQSLDQYGRGRQESAGDSRALLHAISQGVDFFEMIRPFLDRQFGKDQWTVVGSTSASSNDRSSVPQPCEMRLSNTRTRQDYRVVLIACPPGNRAQPRAISSTGAIVGGGTPVWCGPTFPCLWRVSGELSFLDHLPRMLTDLGGRWGEAIDISEEGMCLSWRTIRNARALLWQGEKVTDLGLPDVEWRSFFPSKLTTEGSVLGTTTDIAGRRGAARRYVDGSWERIALGRHAHPTCGTDRMLASADLVGGYEVPWIWMTGESEPTYLPHFLNHSNRPTAISADGRVVGTASGHYCCHPILWTEVDLQVEDEPPNSVLQQA